MKYTLLLLPLALSVLTVSCRPSLPDVPPNTHKVVGPRGSSSELQSWSRTTKQEGDAALPIGTGERR